jgi:hypothetical protein
MGYRALVQRQVDLAFKAIGDLKVSVVLINRTASSFDFAADQAVTLPDEVKTIEGVLTEEGAGSKDRKGSNLSGAVKAELILKSTDVRNPDLYDTAVIDGVAWKFVLPYENNGYTITVNLVRGS